MSTTGRVVASAFLGLVLALSLFIGASLSGVVALAVVPVTALIVPGTGTSNPDAVSNFNGNARTYYLGTTTCAASVGAACTTQGVRYPASLWPLVNTTSQGPPGSFDTYGVSVAKGVTALNGALFTSLQDRSTPNVVVFGFSQGSNVVSNELYDIADYDTATKKRIGVVLTGNTNRPNGGIWTRLGPFGYIPILDVPLGRPTPNDIGIATTDIAYEYDPVGDAPLYPLNLLATANALVGLLAIHPSYLAPNGNTPAERLPDEYTAEELAAALADPRNARHFGDPVTGTTYITLPTKTLPIVQPALLLAQATGTTFLVKPFVDLISPVLRVLIDLGYDRSINPGQYTPFKLIPTFNPAVIATNLVTAAGQGVDAFAHDLGISAPTPRRATTADTNAVAPNVAAPTSTPPLGTRTTADAANRSAQPDASEVDQTTEDRPQDDAVHDEPSTARPSDSVAKPEISAARKPTHDVGRETVPSKERETGPSRETVTPTPNATTSSPTDTAPNADTAQDGPHPGTDDTAHEHAAAA